MAKRTLIDQQVDILAAIRRLRYRPTLGNLKPTPSPFRDSGGTYMMKIARVDAEKILARAKALKLTCAQVVHSREW